MALALPSAVTLLILQHQKKIVRKQVKRQIMHGMDRVQLTPFIFSIEESSALKWEHAGEFELRGMMYDVVYADTINDTIHYYCFRDKEETQINRQLSALVKHQLDSNPENEQQRQQLTTFLLSLACLDKGDWIAQPAMNVLHHWDRQTAMEPVSNAPPFPPPDRQLS